MPTKTTTEKPADQTCKNCDKKFTPKRKWQDFCCHNCRSAWHNKQYAKFKETKGDGK